MGAIVNNQVFKDYKPVSCEPGDIVFFREEFDINQKYNSAIKPTYLYGKVIQANIENEVCENCKNRKKFFVRNLCKHYKDFKYVKLDMMDYCEENNIKRENVVEYFKDNNGGLIVLIPQVLSLFDIIFIIKKDEIVKNLDGVDNAEAKKQILKSIISNAEAKTDIRKHVKKKMHEEKMQKEKEKAIDIEDCAPHMLKIVEGNPIRYKCVKCNGVFNQLRRTTSKGNKASLIFCEKCKDFKRKIKMIRSEKLEDMIRGNYGNSNRCIIYRICKTCGEVDRKEAQRAREEEIRKKKEEIRKKRCKEVIKEFPSLKDVGFLGM